QHFYVTFIRGPWASEEGIASFEGFLWFYLRVIKKHGKKCPVSYFGGDEGVSHIEFGNLGNFAKKEDQLMVVAFGNREKRSVKRKRIVSIMKRQVKTEMGTNSPLLFTVSLSIYQILKFNILENRKIMVLNIMDPFYNCLTRPSKKFNHGSHHQNHHHMLSWVHFINHGKNKAILPNAT
ncbi:hypothetical protein ACJX0J_040464, partial [Zea mays]